MTREEGLSCAMATEVWGWFHCKKDMQKTDFLLQQLITWWALAFGTLRDILCLVRVALHPVSREKDDNYSTPFGCGCPIWLWPGTTLSC